jgi:hypothetical protein
VNDDIGIEYGELAAKVVRSLIENRRNNVTADVLACQHCCQGFGSLQTSAGYRQARARLASQTTGYPRAKVPCRPKNNNVWHYFYPWVCKVRQIKKVRQNT